MTTKETRECLAAILALSLRYRDDIKDGKISWIEALGYLKEVPAIKLAVENIHLVPLELLDLDAEEIPQIAQDLEAILAAWGVSYRSQDITGDVILGLYAMVPTIKIFVLQGMALIAAINAHPPVALPE